MAGLEVYDAIDALSGTGDARVAARNELAYLRSQLPVIGLMHGIANCGELRAPAGDSYDKLRARYLDKMAGMDTTEGVLMAGAGLARDFGRLMELRKANLEPVTYLERTKMFPADLLFGVCALRAEFRRMMDPRPVNVLGIDFPSPYWLCVALSETLGPREEAALNPAANLPDRPGLLDLEPVRYAGEGARGFGLYAVESVMNVSETFRDGRMEWGVPARAELHLEEGAVPLFALLGETTLTPKGRGAAVSRRLTVPVVRNREFELVSGEISAQV